VSSSHGAFSLDSKNFLVSVTKSYYAFIKSLPKELARFFCRADGSGIVLCAKKATGISTSYQISSRPAGLFLKIFTAFSMTRQN